MSSIKLEMDVFHSNLLMLCSLFKCDVPSYSNSFQQNFKFIFRPHKYVFHCYYFICSLVSFALYYHGSWHNKSVVIIVKKEREWDREIKGNFDDERQVSFLDDSPKHRKTLKNKFIFQYRKFAEFFFSFSFRSFVARFIFYSNENL